ncbi:mitochondrial import inner membrane translocase subunit TIM8-like [Phragmites australis]|uniref:mitochondrial import inner membrane translocase subunit TIM8-like n=1 Tax=Phragmites australis TaxID=29695 RepID=UPI002D78A86B|nr:mitochondrial import inner membrane translocase subunit TIM8-like [Phragmites australis]
MVRDMDNSPEQAELMRLMEQEKEQLMVKEMVSKLTSVCWDKCITSTPGSKFSPGETTCLSNCALRFLDMSMILAKRFQMQ